MPLQVVGAYNNFARRHWGTTDIRVHILCYDILYSTVYYIFDYIKILQSKSQKNPSIVHLFIHRAAQYYATEDQHFWYQYQVN